MTKQVSLKRVVEQAAADVKRWPAWMRSDTGKAPKTRQLPKSTKAKKQRHAALPRRHELRSNA